jgi:hypothetical protein
MTGGKNIGIHQFLVESENLSQTGVQKKKKLCYLWHNDPWIIEQMSTTIYRPDYGFLG